MSSGRKKTRTFDLDWNGIFKNLQGIYFEFILSELGKKANFSISGDEGIELLEAIQCQKERLIEEKKIKKAPAFSPIEPREIPFEVPKNWIWCRLGEVGKIVGGGTPSMTNKEYWNGDIPWVTPKDMHTEYVSDAQIRITSKGVEESSANMIPVGSLLIVGRSGILRRKLPVSINTTECTVNQDMKVIIPYVESMNKFLQLLISGLERDILKNYVKYGMTVHSLKYDEFAQMPIPLPPLSEQQRLMDFMQDFENQSLVEGKVYFDSEIEKKVVELHKSQLLGNQLETQLQTQQTLLTKLRQSILQEAVQGKLTERWRAERKGFERTGASQVAGSNPAGGSINDNETAIDQPVTSVITGSGPVLTATGSDETGAELLTRIRAEKAELIRQGKLRKEKPLPPISDAEKPFDLPDGWVWCRLGEINKVTSGITLGKKYAGPLIKVPYLRVANVQRSYINLTLVKELDIPDKELEKYKLEKNDILVNEGGDYDKVGRAAKWSGQIENCIHQNHLFKVRVIDTNPDWITLSINADHSRSHFLGGYVKTTNLASISSVTLKELCIPLPPLVEQQAIVAQVEKALAQVSELEAENRQQQEEVGRLMQAVLREAFSGKETIAEIE